jgi:hypothetical protein
MIWTVGQHTLLGDQNLVEEARTTNSEEELIKA